MTFAWLAGAARNVYSQSGEDGVLDAIFKIIRPANRWCFECGAADGLFFSNTRALVREGWEAILVEADHEAFRRLHGNCVNTKARCLCETVAALDPILAKYAAPPDIDLVSIDVDGQDYYLFNSLLRFRPRVVIVEYDSNAEPDFIPERGCPGQAGLNAMRRLAAGKFYTEVHRTWSNLVLVRQPLDQLLDMEWDPMTGLGERAQTGDGK